jgi:hypothetical protein
VTKSHQLAGYLLKKPRDVCENINASHRAKLKSAIHLHYLLNKSYHVHNWFPYLNWTLNRDQSLLRMYHSSNFNVLVFHVQFDHSALVFWPQNQQRSSTPYDDWLIDYLLFYIQLKNISLNWRCHHYQWRAAKFRLRTFEQGGTFIVPHLLWHRASFFLVSSIGLPQSATS